MGSYDRYELVRAYDPAIDLEATGAMQGTQVWEEYLATRDPSLLTYLEGESPVVYHCRVLTLKERRDLRSKATVSDQAERSFALCVMKIDNMRFPDGSRRTWTRAHENRPITDDELGSDLFVEQDIQHIGFAIYTLSFLAKDSPRYVPVRGTCQDAMIASALAWRRRHAEHTKIATTTGTDDSSS